MTVITLSSELGSGGRAIARQVATTLGYEVADKYILDETLRKYGLTKFEELYNSVPSFLDLFNADNLTLVAIANEIVEALAARGNIVIIGRTGFAVLGEYADVLHVHTQAPFADRARQILSREGLADIQAAEALVSSDDAVHSKYVRRFYNKEWDKPSSFDLIIDTSKVAGDVAVQQICDAVAALATRSPRPEGPTSAVIVVDPVLADAVDQAMESASRDQSV